MLGEGTRLKEKTRAEGNAELRGKAEGRRVLITYACAEGEARALRGLPRSFGMGVLFRGLAHPGCKKIAHPALYGGGLRLLIGILIGIGTGHGPMLECVMPLLC